MILCKSVHPDVAFELLENSCISTTVSPYKPDPPQLPRYRQAGLHIGKPCETHECVLFSQVQIKIVRGNPFDVPTKFQEDLTDKLHFKFSSRLYMEALGHIYALLVITTIFVIFLKISQLVSSILLANNY